MLASLEVCVSPDDPMLVRPGCFVKHPDFTPTVPFRFRLLFKRLSTDLYVLLRVAGQTFSIYTPFAGTYITRVDLQPREILFCRLDNVLAFSERAFPSRLWKIDVVSMLMGQFSYTYFRGPGTLYVCGVNGLIVEEVDGFAEYDTNKVLGWTHTLKVGVTSKHSLLAAAMGTTEVCIDQFSGTGKVVVQASSTPVSRVARNQHGRALSWLELLAAILGLPWPMR